MPAPTDAPLRYQIIDSCLTNEFRPYPSMADIIKACKKELGKEYSIETIQKDILAMKKNEKLGYFAPIKYSNLHQGYFYTVADFTIKTAELNEKEIEAIELAAGILKHFKGLKVNDSFNHALDKLLSSVDKEKFKGTKGLSEAIQPEEVPYLQGMEHFAVFTSAIRKQTPVSFIHYSYSKLRFKSIIIHPYLIKESNKRWYIVGYSEDHKEVRNFGIDRVYDPIALNKTFIVNSNSNLLNLFTNKIGLNTLKNYKNNNEQPEEVILKVSSEISNYLKTLPIHHSQKIIHHTNHGSIVITLNLVPTIELVAIILSYGSNMIVESPQWLKKEVEKEIRKASNYYKID